jgi:hypothetical protein
VLCLATSKCAPDQCTDLFEAPLVAVHNDEMLRNALFRGLQGGEFAKSAG